MNKIFKKLKSNFFFSRRTKSPAKSKILLVLKSDSRNFFFEPKKIIWKRKRKIDFSPSLFSSTSFDFQYFEPIDMEIEWSPSEHVWWKRSQYSPKFKDINGWRQYRSYWKFRPFDATSFCQLNVLDKADDWSTELASFKIIRNRFHGCELKNQECRFSYRPKHSARGVMA